MQNEATYNILIAGVGGQGTVLASKILGDVAMAAGFDVKQSEIHGMSQRGGSVVTHVKFGRKVYSPLVARGQGDVLLAFEELEGLRYLPFLKAKGRVILNLQQMLPMPVILGQGEYPQLVEETIEEAGFVLEAAPAAQMADSLGNAKAANVVLLGLLARHLDFPKEAWTKAIQDNVKARFVEMNLKAFELGYCM